MERFVYSQLGKVLRHDDVVALVDEAELVGDNRSRLDNVRWMPVSEESQYTVTTPDPVPFADIRTAYSNYWQAAEGDYEAAAFVHQGGTEKVCLVLQFYENLDRPLPMD